MCGWQVKLCDPLVTHGPYLSALEIKGLYIKHYTNFGLLYFTTNHFTHILYALPAWGCFLSKELTGRIDAFLKRCYRCGFASDIERVGCWHPLSIAKIRPIIGHNLQTEQNMRIVTINR